MSDFENNRQSVKYLQDHSEKPILLAVYDKSGFSIYREDSRIKGYDHFDENIEKLIIEKEIPAIDATNIPREDLGFMFSMPSINEDPGRSFEYPFGPYSKAPAEVIANIWRKMGAESMYNVEQMPLTQEMFRGANLKETLMHKGFFGNDTKAMVDGLLERDDQNTFVFPEDENLPQTKAYFDQLNSELEANRKLQEELEAERKEISKKYRDQGDPRGFEKPDSKKNSSDRLAASKANKLITSAICRTLYAASFARAKPEYSDSDAFRESSAWSSNMVSETLNHYKEKGLKNSIDQYKSGYDGLKMAKKSIEKSKSVALGITTDQPKP